MEKITIDLNEELEFFKRRLSGYKLHEERIFKKEAISPEDYMILLGKIFAYEEIVEYLETRLKGLPF